MSNPANNHKINYIEFTTTDIEKTKQFYEDAFGWTFQSWGPDYLSFAGAGVDGGFAKGAERASSAAGEPLIVLYANDLGATEKAITTAGGTITTPTFEYPGGRRFHFSDNAGNTLAVWSD